jgi:TolB-like protein
MDARSSSEKSVSPGQDSVLPPAEAVQAQLAKILESQAFANSERLSRFLRFTVEQTLRGRGDQIKEYLLGLEVFDRKQTYDPRTDPIVRVEAGRLRSKLSQYYDTEGRNDPLVIEYRKGSYVPAFQKRDPHAPGSADASVRGLLGGRKLAMLLAILAVAGSIIFSFAYRSRSGPSSQELAESNTTGHSIAVLPFESLSDDRQEEHFADGITEALIAELSKVKGLQVVSRISVMRYKGMHRPLTEIVHDLNVEVIMAGSVTFSGKRVRVIAHLINAKADRKLLAETYERDLGDSLRLQGELARTIADAVKTRMARA